MVWLMRFALSAEQHFSNVSTQTAGPFRPLDERQVIMKKNLVFFFGLAAIVLASVASTFGQEKSTTFEKEVPTGVALQWTGQGPEPARNTFTFVNSEFSFDKLVKGSPYSAQAVTETTQVLSDGNRIVNTSSAAVYRDGEARTRGEQKVTEM